MLSQLFATFVAAASMLQAPVGPPATQPAGLQIIEMGQNDLVSQKGDLLVVHYTGRLVDGTVFDTTLRDPARPTPFSFKLGEDRVIEGWQQGMAGMKVGQRRRLVIPPELGYGARGTGDGRIPPNATLVFDVEVIYIHRPTN